MEILNSQNDTLVGDSGFLAGRQRQVFDLLSLFQTSQLIGFFGENGSGKTTLIKKALFPELEKGFLGIAGKKWRTIIIRPGITPLENLSAGIAQLGLTSGKQKLEEEVFLTQSMRLSNEGLKNACLQDPTQKSDFNSLLVIDNFEDLFQFREVAPNVNEWDEAVKSFIQNITKCASYSSIPVYFLVVLRTEYMSKLFDYRHFYEKVSSSQYNLPQFRKSEFTEVINVLLSTSKKKIHKDGMDYLYNQFGKDLKNLTFLGHYINEVVASTADSSQNEIGLETLLQIPADSLFASKLDNFYDACTETQKIVIEKLFKQITVTPEAASLSRPILIDHFLKVSGSQLNELGPLLQSIQNTFNFVFDIVLPLQERLEVKNHPLTSEAAVIDIKNEQFIPNWPRLVDWIKEERDSQDLYKKLSEKSSLFDKGLTDFLKSPDLDIALAWYEEQHPDILWGNQFDSNYERTISYLLTSKAKFEEEILKKELAQKEKAKRLRKSILIGSIIGVVVFITISIFAVKATIQQEIAKDALRLAEDEKIIAEKAEENAKVAADSAREASKRAIRDQKEAEISAKKALAATIRANESEQVATKSLIKAKDANEALEASSVELKKTFDALEVTKNAEMEAKIQANNSKEYQQSLYEVSALRNDVQMHEQEYQEDEFNKLLNTIKERYSDFSEISLKINGVIVPNNDMYQVLLKIRRKLIDQGTIKGIPEDLEKTSRGSGLRKIIVSPTGAIAAGGDDGILLYTKQALGQGVVFTKFPLGRDGDRIRSMEFVNDKELVMGTVNGKLYLFSTITGVNKLLEIGLVPKQIVEDIVPSSKGVFVLAGGQVRRVPLSELTKTASGPQELPKAAAVPKELPKSPGIPKDLPKSAAISKELIKAETVPNLSVKSIFKFTEDKLLAVRNDNTIILLDMATLQWQPISNDLPESYALKKVAVTSVVNSGGNLFLGMDNGDVILCKNLKLGNVTSIKYDLIITAHKTRITSLAFDASSNKLFSASLDQTANIFDLNMRNVSKSAITEYKYKIEGFDKWIWDFALVQTGKVKTLLTVDESGELKSWQTDAEVLYNEIYAATKK
jgi:hypothetical protein